MKRTYKVLLTLLLNCLVMNNVFTYEIKEEISAKYDTKELTEASTTLELEKETKTIAKIEKPNTDTLNFQDEIQEIIPDKFYIAKIKDNNLYGVIERLSDENIEDWKRYAHVQISSYKIGQEYLSHFNDSGSSYFYKVIEEKSHKDNEIWIIYLTSNSTPIYDPKKFQFYTINTIDEYKKITDAKSFFSVPTDIKIFTTITSHRNALISSHMGISKTIESIINSFKKSEKYKTISMDLHSLGAKFILMKDPKKRLMITAPVRAMTKIMIENLPIKSLSIGTKEMMLKFNETKKITYEEYKDQNKSLCKCIEISVNGAADDELTLWQEKIQKNGTTKTVEEFQKNKEKIKYLEQKNDNFIISPERVERMKEINLRKWFNIHRINHFNCLFEILKMDIEKFINFIDQNISLISTMDNPNETITIYDPTNPDLKLITITQENSSYTWMFNKIFKPGDYTPYVAIDLHVLANSTQLQKTLTAQQLRDQADLDFIYNPETIAYFKSIGWDI